MKKLSAILSSLVCSVLVAQAAEPAKAPSDQPVTQARETYGKVTWLERHAQIIERNRTVQPGIVFIGDSITHFWWGEPVAHRATDKASWEKATGGRTATNLGFGFDYIENALWRVDHGELDGIRPRVIVILLGTNNLGHKGDTPEACERGMKALLGAVRAKQPAAKILLLGIYPRHEARLADAIAETNRRYAALAGGGVRFLDIGAALAEPGKPRSPAGPLFSDGLHPNAAGYRVIGEQLAPVIAGLAGETSGKP